MTALLAGCCKNPNVRMKKPIPVATERDDSGWISTWARGDVGEYGQGDSRMGAVEDLVACSAEAYLQLEPLSENQMSAHLVKEKSILSEYFERVHPSARVAAPTEPKEK